MIQMTKLFLKHQVNKQKKKNETDKISDDSVDRMEQSMREEDDEVMKKLNKSQLHQVMQHVK